MVSVIIINYNTFKITCDCISSVYEKTTDVEFEILLVDQASSEENPDKFKILFPKINLIKSPVNSGFAKGNNLGISKSKGEYILLLNSDTILKNNAIWHAKNILDSNKEFGALSGNLYFPNNTKQYPGERFPNLTTELRELLRLNKRLSKVDRAERFLGDQFDHNSQKEVDWIWGTFFFTKKKIIEELNGQLPDTYFMYAEDVDWCWKIKKLGYKIIFDPTPEIIHLGGMSYTFTNQSSKFLELMFPNRFHVVAKHKGYIYAWLTYFIKAIHLITLRSKPNIQKAKFYLKFLFWKKNYWLNN